MFFGSSDPDSAEPKHLYTTMTNIITVRLIESKQIKGDVIMRFTYGNSRQELEFDVRVNVRFLEDLQMLGYLDEEFDIDEWFEDDSYDWSDDDVKIRDAIIDYYEDRADSKLEFECEKMENGELYDDEFVDLSSDLDRMYDLWICGDRFQHCDVGGCDMVHIGMGVLE